MDREYLNSGTLFAAKVKKNPKAPDYYGDLLIDLSAFQVVDGKIKVALAGWKKTSKNGKQFLSVSAKQFEERTTQPVVETKEQDDDIPF